MLGSLAWAEQDWPQWRGSHRDGKSSETGILNEFTSEGPPLLWEAKDLGAGYSSISVAGGRIFTLGRRGDAEQLIAVDEQDGREIWAADVGEGGHSNGTPTVDGQRVYVIGLNGDLICADTNSGEVIWRKDFEKDFGGKMMSGWGYSESPLVDGNRLVCTPGAEDAMIVSLDKHTGEEILARRGPRLWQPRQGRCGLFVDRDFGRRGCEAVYPIDRPRRDRPAIE